MTRLPPQFKALALVTGLAGCVPVPVGQYWPIDHQPTRPWPATAGCSTPPGADSSRNALLSLMNAARTQAGLGGLTLDPAITAVSQRYACENAARRSISHVGSDGSDITERFRRGGLRASLEAENTGLFRGGAQHAFDWWMGSPHHRDNILRAQITKVGIGLAAAGGETAWVVDFLAPR